MLPPPLGPASRKSESGYRRDEDHGRNEMLAILLRTWKEDMIQVALINGVSILQSGTLRGQ